MATFRLIPVDQPNAWNHALARCGQYDSYHLPGYHLVARQQGEGEPYLFLFEDQGRYAALPFLLRRVGELDGLEDRKCRDAASVYGYPGLITSVSRLDHHADQFRQGFQAALRDVMESLEVVALFGRQNPLIDSSWMFSPMVQTTTLGYTVAIDLAQTEEEQLRQFRNNHRRDIRRARRQGLTVDEDPTFERMDVFRQLYLETMDSVGAVDYYYFPAEYFTNLEKQLSRSVKLYFAEQGGNIVAGALFLLTGGIIQYHLGGRAAGFEHCRGAIKLIFDEVRAWGTRNRFSWLHLGGGLGARQDSLFHFKAGFSRIHLPFHTVKLVLQPERYRDLVGRREQWSHRNGFQSVNDQYFPAYRRPSGRRAA